jgi:hypothetical protein
VPAALLAAPSAQAATDHCRPLPKRATVVAKNKTATVYTVPNGLGDKNLYGCLRSNGHRTKIAEGSDDGIEAYSKFDQIRLNGRFVAWQWNDYDISCKAACPEGYDPNTFSLERFDLKRGRPYQVTGEATAGALVVSGRFGRIAWVQKNGDAFEVHVNKRVVDSGAIDPASFKLAGSTLSWTNAGAPKTTTLR